MSLANWIFPHDPGLCVCVCVQIHTQIASTVELRTMPTLSSPLLPKSQMKSCRYEPFLICFQRFNLVQGNFNPKNKQSTCSCCCKQFRFCSSGVPLVSGSHAPVLVEAAELASFLLSANALLPSPPRLCQPSVLWAQLSPSFPKMDLLILYLVFLVALGNSQGEKGEMPTFIIPKSDISWKCFYLSRNQ